MADILIQDVPAATVAEIDRRARDQGISRTECLRRWLIQEFWPVASVSVDDLRRLGRLAADLADPEIMRQAWS